MTSERSRDRELPQSPIKVNSVFDLQTGVMYRLHVYKPRSRGGRRHTTQDFYLPDSFNPEEAILFSRIPIRKPNPKPEGPNGSWSSDFYTSFEFEMLGFDFRMKTELDRVDRKLKGSYFTTEELNRTDLTPEETTTRQNWVELLPGVIPGNE